MNRNFDWLTGRPFDLLVCGGGIYGAWTAYDAALRGLKVAIVEQGDWASACSCASSKLIHGGLRYLESFDFALVQKSLAERQRLLQMAPHRVWPLRFGVPIYADSRIGDLRMKVGLALYDFLASQPDPEMRHCRFDQAAFAKHFPMLAEGGLKGGYTYNDAQTDDARLVLELISGAQQAGAVCVNYCKLTALHETHGRASGATVLDLPSQTSAHISARQIVYTAGQWMAKAAPSLAWCRLSKGTHLVMPRLPTEEALLLTAQSDGRVFFLIPWYGRTLLGTTDEDYRGDVERVSVTPAEVAYLLEEANRYLKTAWTDKDVVGSYAGLRVLKRSRDARPSAASRDWELKTTANGVHYSIGGKLTSARSDAACIVDAVCLKLQLIKPCASANLRFPWAPDAGIMAAASIRAKRLNIDPECALWLLRRHGKWVDAVFDLVENNPLLAERILPALPLIHADLLYCASNEMAVHLQDLLRRRMPLAILARLELKQLGRLAVLVAPAMGWDAGRITEEITRCLA